MPQELPSHDRGSLLTAPLRAMTHAIVSWPKVTLAVSLLVALAAVALTLVRLEMRTSRLDLLNPKSRYNQLWLEFIAEFGAEDDTVIVVEGQDAEQVRTAMDLLARQLERHGDTFHSVLHKVDLSAARSRALFYLPTDDLAELDRRLVELEPVLAGDWAGFNVGNLLGYLALATTSRDEDDRAAASATLTLHMQNLQRALVGDARYESPWEAWDELAEIEDRFTPHYSLVKQGRMGIVLLRLADDGSSFDRGSGAIDELRILLDDFQQQHAGIQVGLTGLPVMENDEMRANKSASTKTCIISLIGVAGVFIAGFGGIRHPLLAVAALMVGIAWACGYLTLAVGHLNILSMAFGVILVGLGIDFGIHYVARYLAVRGESPDSASALIRTATSIGPGVITGGVTTAIAFFAAGLTDFTGIAELGLIAGGGIVLCVAAAIIVLPALIQLVDRGPSRFALPRPMSIAPSRWLTDRLPRLTLLASAVLTLGLCWGLSHIWYDHNLLHLQPVGLESVQLEKRLLAETDQSVWYALSIADTPAQLLERKAQFEELPSVERTEEIASFQPADVQDKQPLVQSIRARLANLPDEPPIVRVDPPEQLVNLLERVHAQLAQNNLATAAAGIRRLAATLDAESKSKCYACLSQYQQTLASDLLARLRGLRAMSNPEPPSFDQLPAGLKDRFVGRQGKHLLKVYSNSDIWDMAALEKFVWEVRGVDSRATGKPLQTYEASRQMQRSYVYAAMYALIGVTIVLVIDFQSLGFALLALAPVALGMLQMFGLLGLLGIPLNPANMIVLPLILGIGLDDGVHVLHDFRCQQGPFRLSHSTATAVLITSLTTMVGFGSMMIADHRGLQSLGRVLTIGVTCCLFTSLIPLPALLAWLTHRRAMHAESEQSPDSTMTNVVAPWHVGQTSELSASHGFAAGEVLSRRDARN